MTKFFVVCGQRNSGKTSWVCAIAHELSRRGIRVGTVKHTHHPHDIEGKDTHRHQTAGAEKVVMVSPSGTATYEAWDLEPSLKEIIGSHFVDYEIIVVEGYRESPFPKIIVGNDPNATREDVIADVHTVENGRVDPDELTSVIAVIAERFGLELEVE